MRKSHGARHGAWPNSQQRGAGRASERAVPRAESRAPHSAASLLNSAHSWVLSRQRKPGVGNVPRGKDPGRQLTRIRSFQKC